jgi:hypothetical protein
MDSYESSQPSWEDSIEKIPTHKNARALLALLDTEFINRMNAVQKYSSDVALGDGIVQILPGTAATEFVKGPILWPSLFIYENGDTCNLATSIFTAVTKAVDLIRISYDKNERPQRPPVSLNPLKIFIEGWQRGSSSGQNFTDVKIQESGEYPFYTKRLQMQSERPWYIRLPVDLVTRVTGLSEIPMIGLALELPEVISRMFRCDVKAVMFCTSHHYSVIASSGIAIIILTVMGSIFSFTGIPIIATLLSLLSFVSLVMFISFDYAPACAPMIPTCFFDSMVDDVVTFLPKRITIPQSLISCKWDQTVEGPPPASCIVSCEKHPYQFHEWTSNVAWILCGYSPELCESVESYIKRPGNPFSMIAGDQISENIESAFHRSRLILRSNDQNMREGYSWCNTLTFYNVMPIMFIVGVTAAAIPLSIGMLLRGFVGVVRIGFSAFAMSHS